MDLVGGGIFGCPQLWGSPWPPYDMLEAELMVAGVCAPDTFDSLPYAEVVVEGEGRQYPDDEGEVSATEEEGRYPGVGHWVSIDGG